jgi:hypothetical protein
MENNFSAVRIETNTPLVTPLAAVLLCSIYFVPGTKANHSVTIKNI